MAHEEITAEQLRQRRGQGEDVFVLDVREDWEVAEWPFPGAHHIPLAELAGRIEELPRDRQVVVVCHAGVRSEAAADALDRDGWPAANLLGGIVAWSGTEEAS
jgi:rhodanese-related sulfurtransferase